jgi:predicted O-methyltransferase YrrM
LFLDYLHQLPLYAQLRATYETIEGNLLEVTDERVAEAQIEALRLGIARTAPRRVLETGTAKGFFGLLLSQVTTDLTLYTFDGNPRSAAAVELLNDGQDHVRAVFTLGDTKHTLSQLDVDGIGFAWIDGGHDLATASSDIAHAMRLAIPLIAVDDTRTMPETARAVDAALATEPGYRRWEHPFFLHDSRGIAFLVHDRIASASPT